MGWRGQFKLGRPALEQLFDINPAALDLDNIRIEDEGRGLTGRLLSVSTSRDRPTARLTGNYLTPRMANMLRHLARIDDTSLVFEPLDSTGNQVFEVWQDKLTPLTTTTLQLAEDSYQRAAELRANAGGATIITPVGVWRTYAADSREGGGTNYGGITASYSEPFDARTLGNLGGQDLWVDLSGAGSIIVSATTPIAGTRSAKILLGGFVAATVYRRLLTFAAGAYTFNWKMRYSTANGSAPFDLRAMSADSITGANTSWAFDLRNVAGTPRVRTYVGSVVAAADVAISSLTGSHDFEVSRSVANVLTFKVDGVTIHSAAQTVAPNRIMLTGTRITGPDPNIGNAWDDLALSVPGVATYNPINNILTLGTSLPDLSPVYATFQATGFACELSRIPARTEGGWGSDLWKYGGLEIKGA